jgi:hypothetical protein
MSMFSGLGSQISGFVAQKIGKGGEGAPPEGGEPQEMPQENGEEVPQQEGGGGGPLGGAMGFAQGLMMKAAAAKEGIKEKASGLSAGNLQVWWGSFSSTSCPRSFDRLSPKNCLNFDLLSHVWIVSC